MSGVKSKMKKLDPSVTDLENFAKEIFGLELYPWQKKAMEAVTGEGGKCRVAVRAANGSGTVSYTHLTLPTNREV